MCTLKSTLKVCTLKILYTQNLYARFLNCTRAYAHFLIVRARTLKICTLVFLRVHINTLKFVRSFFELYARLRARTLII